MSQRFLIIIGLVIAGLSVASFFYYPYAGLTTISEDNAIIRYPKYLKHQIIPSTQNNYRNHQFQLVETGRRSEIVVSVPIGESFGLKNPGIQEFFNLSDIIVSKSTLNDIPGQKASMRSPQYEGDVYIPSTIHYELYPSHIASSPLNITYTRVDGTRGLEKELAIIKKYLRWSVGKVITINQFTNTSVEQSNKNINTFENANSMVETNNSVNIQPNTPWETLVAQSSATSPVVFGPLQFEIPTLLKRTDSEEISFFNYPIDAPEGPYISFATSNDSTEAIINNKKSLMSETETVVRDSTETINSVRWKVLEQTTDFGINQVVWVADSSMRVVVQYVVTRDDVTAVFENIIRSAVAR